MQQNKTKKPYFLTWVLRKINDRGHSISTQQTSYSIRVGFCSGHVSLHSPVTPKQFPLTVLPCCHHSANVSLKCPSTSVNLEWWLIWTENATKSLVNRNEDFWETKETWLQERPFHISCSFSTCSSFVDGELKPLFCFAMSATLPMFVCLFVWFVFSGSSFSFLLFFFTLGWIFCYIMLSFLNV